MITSNEHPDMTRTPGISVPCSLHDVEKLLERASGDLDTFSADVARVLNLLTTRSSKGGKVKLSFDVFRKLSALLDNFSSLLSKENRRECLPTAFDQMATIIHFMYDNIQFAEKQLEIETFHLKLVKLLLALKCFDIASEQALVLLHRLEELSSPHRTVRSSNAKEAERASRRYSSFVVGCWLSMLAAFAELNPCGHKYESTLRLLVNSLERLNFRILQSGNCERHNGVIFRYTLRLLEKLSNAKARDESSEIDKNDAFSRSLSKFTLFSCVKSDCADQLPNLIRMFAQLHGFENFKYILSLADMKQLQSFSADTWMIAIEKLGAHACQSDRQLVTVHQILLIEESIQLGQEHQPTIYMILMRLATNGLGCEKLSLCILEFMRSARHESLSRCEVNTNKQFWRCVRDFASEVCKCLNIPRSDPHIKYASRTSEILLQLVVSLLKAIEETLSSSSSDDTIVPIVKVSMMSLTMAYVSLKTICFQFSTCASNENACLELKQVLRVCHHIVEERQFLKIEDFLLKLVQRSNSGPNLEMLLDADCHVCALLAVSNTTDVHTDRLSLRLMARNRILLELGGRPEIVLSSMLVNRAHESEVRAVYAFELVRCLCALPDTDRQELCALAVFGYLRNNQELDWTRMLTEHYSAWQEAICFRVRFEEQIFVETCLISSLHNDAKLLSNFDHATSYEMLIQMFDCLLLLMAKHTFAGGFHEGYLQMETVDKLINICEILSRQESTGCEYRDFYRSAKEIEFAAHLLYFSCAQQNASDFNDSNAKFALKYEKAMRHLRRLSGCKQQNALFDSIKNSFMNTFCVLESTHSKLCFTGNILATGSLFAVVVSTTGIELDTRLCARELFLLTDPSYTPTFNNSKQVVPSISWYRSESGFESVVHSELLDICRLRREGKLVECVKVTNQTLHKLRLALKLGNIIATSNGDHDDSGRLQYLRLLRHDGIEIKYGVSFWHLMTVYMQVLFLKSLVAHSIGCTEMSKRILDEAVRTCESLNLLDLSNIVQVQYTLHIMETSLDFNNQFRAQKILNAQTTGHSMSNPLQDVFVLSISYLRHMGCSDELDNERACENCIEASLATLQSLQQYGTKLEMNPWIQWCTRLTAKMRARKALYVDIESANELLSQSRQWLQGKPSPCAADEAFILLIQSTIEVGRLCGLQQSNSSLALHRFSAELDYVRALLQKSLQLTHEFPIFVKKLAALNSIVQVLYDPLASLNLTKSMHVMCGATFIQQSIVELASRVSDPTLSAKSCRTELDSREELVMLQSSSTDMQLKMLAPDSAKKISVTHPLITLCESTLGTLDHKPEHSSKVEILLTRSSVVPDEIPVVVTLPWIRPAPDSISPVQELRDILASKANSNPNSLKGDMKREEKIAWWEHRIAQDIQLKELVHEVQSYTLGCWWFLLLGEPRDDVIKVTLAASSEIMCRLRDIGVLEGLELFQHAPHAIRLLLQNATKMQLNEIQTVLCSMFRGGEKHFAWEEGQDAVDAAQQAIQSLTTHCKDISLSILAASKTGSGPEKRLQGPILLLFEGYISEFPWESLPLISDQEYYRIPCALYSQECATFPDLQCSQPIRYADLSNTLAVLNPDGDLLETEKVLLPAIMTNKSWKIITGVHPSGINEALALYDMFLFFGHGTAQQYLRPTSVVCSWKSIMILMGCSSGALVSQGELGYDGVVLSYMIKGSPAVVANLWDVTDKDIDRFSLELIGGWRGGPNSSKVHSISTSVIRARAKCRLKFLTGGAPVIYGVPAFVRE